MEVKIGVQHSPREIVVEVAEDAATVESQVAKAVADGGVLTLSDAKGRRILVPASKVAYVEIGGGVTGHVGFRS